MASHYRFFSCVCITFIDKTEGKLLETNASSSGSAGTSRQCLIFVFTNIHGTISSFYMVMPVCFKDYSNIRVCFQHCHYFCYLFIITVIAFSVVIIIIIYICIITIITLIIIRIIYLFV